MALNAGILFETPEKFFLKASQRIHSHFDVSGSIRLCDMVRTSNERAFRLFIVDFCLAKRKWNQLFYSFAFYNLQDHFEMKLNEINLQIAAQKS
jgi:hypothetical protein